MRQTEPLHPLHLHHHHPWLPPLPLHTTTILYTYSLTVCVCVCLFTGKLATYTQRPPPSSTPPSVARQTDRTSSAPGNGTDQLYPFFDYYVPRNITTTIGQSAFLHCRTENLNDKSVSVCGLTIYIIVSEWSPVDVKYPEYRYINV